MFVLLVASAAAAAAADATPFKAEFGGGPLFATVGPPDRVAADSLRTLNDALAAGQLASSAAFDKANHSLLNMAAFYGNVEAARALVNAGADVNHRDVSGHAPLHHAAFCPGTCNEQTALQIVQLLLGAGAQTSVVEKLRTRRTPLAVAKARPSQATLFGQHGWRGKHCVV